AHPGEDLDHDAGWIGQAGKLLEVFDPRDGVDHSRIVEPTGVPGTPRREHRDVTAESRLDLVDLGVGPDGEGVGAQSRRLRRQSAIAQAVAVALRDRYDGHPSGRGAGNEITRVSAPAGGVDVEGERHSQLRRFMYMSKAE